MAGKERVTIDDHCTNPGDVSRSCTDATSGALADSPRAGNTADVRAGTAAAFQRWAAAGWLRLRVPALYLPPVLLECLGTVYDVLDLPVSPHLRSAASARHHPFA